MSDRTQAIYSSGLSSTSLLKTKGRDTGLYDMALFQSELCVDYSVPFNVLQTLLYNLKLIHKYNILITLHYMRK